MPVPRPELSAEVTVDGDAGLAAARDAGAASGLARDAGPDTLSLAGDRDAVLRAALAAVEAALGAGAERVRASFEPERP